MKATIDRFEGELAVLLVEGQEQRRKRSSLPAGSAEGDVIDLSSGEIDREATEALRQKVRESRARAFKKHRGPGSLE